MLTRVAWIAFNTYREAVRARMLLGMLGLAVATAGYVLIVSAFANRAQLRVVSDLGSASISVYGVLVAIVLGATSLYRELELKTLFPILARPLRRSEYLVGKFLGSWLTLSVFIVTNTGALLVALAVLSGAHPKLGVGAAVGWLLLFGLGLWRLPRWRIWLPLPAAVLLLLCGVALSAGSPDEQRVLCGSALLSWCEVAIVAACATLFSAFSSPFLTALFTLGLFVVGRSADTLANLPLRMFGAGLRALGGVASAIVPNLMVYAPERSLLTGEAPGVSLARYLMLAVVQAIAWVVLLLTAASWLFRRRDFL